MMSVVTPQGGAIAAGVPYPRLPSTCLGVLDRSWRIRTHLVAAPAKPRLASFGFSPSRTRVAAAAATPGHIVNPRWGNLAAAL